MKHFFISLRFGILLFISGIISGEESKKPNILFIAIDDLNDWVGFLDGHLQALTPNMDRLAKRGRNLYKCTLRSPGLHMLESQCDVRHIPSHAWQL